MSYYDLNQTNPLLNKRKQKDFVDKNKRLIALGEYFEKRHLNSGYQNNKITTTKYNIISWLPKSLIIQFRRLANLYFLIIAILNFFPFSPKV